MNIVYLIHCGMCFFNSFDYSDLKQFYDEHSAYMTDNSCSAIRSVFVDIYNSEVNVPSSGYIRCPQLEEDAKNPLTNTGPKQVKSTSDNIERVPSVKCVYTLFPTGTHSWTLVHYCE